MTHTHNDLKYWTYNDDKAMVAVFIHGFTGSHEGFQYIISELSDIRIIVPDLPGFGESKLGIDKFSIDEIARRVNEFVSDLNLKTTPYLVSHSMGGLVAASMLHQNPELFHKKTIFISPVATRVNYLDPRKLGVFFGGIQYLAGKTVPVIGPLIVRSRLISRLVTAAIITAQQPKLRNDIYQHHFKNLDYISSIDYYYQLHKDINSKGAIDYADSLKQFDMLIVTGDNDNVTPLSTEKKLQQATGAKLELIEGVGHLLHYERPKEVAAAIDGFLNL